MLVLEFVQARHPVRPRHVVPHQPAAERVVGIVEIDGRKRGVDVAGGLAEAGAAGHRPAVAQSLVDGDVGAIEIAIQLGEVVPEVVDPAPQRRRLVIDRDLPAAVRLGHLERDVALEWNGNVPGADVPAGFAADVAGRDDHVAGQLVLELDVVLVRRRPLQIVAVAVVDAEREAVRCAELVELRRQIAVEIAGGGLPGGAHRPVARVVRRCRAG